MKNLLLIACFWGLNTPLLVAQDTVKVERTELKIEKSASKYYPKSRMAGLNVTPLLTQLIPFNRADPRDFGPFLMRFKNYKNSNNAVRFGLGVQILGEDIFFSDEASKTFLHIHWGWERRKNISDRWAYTKGIDAVAFVGGLNLPGEGSSEEANLGIGLPWGIEYAIAPRITLSTEAELAILVGGFGPTIRLLPPVGLFLNYYFTK
jgi:hypothetical protein